MADCITTSRRVSRRRSSWFPVEHIFPPSSSAVTLDHPPLSRRASVMSLRDKLHDFDPVRSMSMFKNPPSSSPKLPSKSSVSGSPKRPGHSAAPTSAFGSFREKLLKKRPSEPLLSTVSEHHTETCTIAPIPTIITTPADADGLSYGDWCPPVEGSTETKSYWEDRKMTVVPETVIGGLGFLQPPANSHTKRRASVEVDLSRECFREMNSFPTKDGMRVHPYPREKAPYMQAYNRILLENERYNHILLTRINTNNSPTFHNYGVTPPSRVLDLGCGQGLWAIDAAAAWKAAGTHITGFDLMDLVPEDAKDLDNVSWARGNFVEYPLPFPDEHFDLVRLADLTFCVPFARWEHVFCEAKRVLKIGGRVEIVDDHLFFPYVDTAVRRSHPPYPNPRPYRESWSSAQSKLSLSTLASTDQTFSDETDATSSTQPDLYSGDTPSDSDCDELLTPAEADVDVSAFASIKGKEPYQQPTSPAESFMEPNPEQTCRHIEQVFEAMLIQSFEVHTRPHDLFKMFLERVFTRHGDPKKLQSFHLHLPGPDDLVAVAEKSKAGLLKSKDSMKRVVAEWESQERERIERMSDESLALAQSEGKLSSKAAKLLGLNAPKSCQSSQDNLVRTLAGASASSLSSMIGDTSSTTANSSILTRSRSHSSTKASPYSPSPLPLKLPAYNAPGLILYPDTFIPMPPFELEMHISKHIHTLLGCKAALGEFATSKCDPEGNPLVPKDIWDEWLFRYESYRRQRFNLPDAFDVPDDDDDPLSSTTSSSSLKRAISLKRSAFEVVPADSRSNGPGTPVRVIRVYEAYKVPPAAERF